MKAKQTHKTTRVTWAVPPDLHAKVQAAHAAEIGRTKKVTSFAAFVATLIERGLAK